MTGTPRLLIHAQNLLGVGHRVRVHRIAAACTAAGMDVALTVAEDAGGDTPPPGVAAVPLPDIRARDADFSARVDAAGSPVTEALWAERRSRLLAAQAARRPHVALVEGYPVARRAFAGEIVPWLEAARADGAQTAASLRDILVAKPDPVRAHEVIADMQRYLGRVLVHGDPAIARLGESVPGADALAARTIYTGYVAPGTPPDGHAPARAAPDAPVIVSAGGGAAGARLFAAALAARRAGFLAERRWRLLAGPNLLAEARARLATEAAALPGTTVEPALAGDAFRRALAGAALSISQAGYNTAVDLWLTRPPAVVVPFAGRDGHETEQPHRAARLAMRGEAVVLAEAALTGCTLARAGARAVAAPPPATRPPDLDGARATAQALAALASRSRLG